MIQTRNQSSVEVTPNSDVKVPVPSLGGKDSEAATSSTFFVSTGAISYIGFSIINPLSAFILSNSAIFGFASGFGFGYTVS